MIRKNNRTNKIISMFTAVIMLFGIFVTMLQQAETVYAGSENVSLNINANPSGGYRVNGHSSLSSNYTTFSAKGAKIRNSSGNVLYCLDPLLEAKNGEHATYNLLGYQGLSQYDINYLATGVDYLNSNYGTNDAEALGQFFVWDYLNGKTSFNATVTPTTMGSGTYAAGLAKAHEFASEKAGTATGSGVLYTNGSSQPLVALSISYGGYLNLTKAVKNNKHLTDLCPEQYNLAGAEYYISTGADGSGYVGTLTTTATGATNTIYLNAGRYYAKEVKAPAGFKLDPTYYPVDVISGQTATVNASDEPVLDPLNWKAVTKKIKEGSDKNLSVKGAEFTVKYYNTLKSIEGKDPTKTWTFLADDKGNVIWDDSYLKEGSEPLLKNENNRNSGLIGIYTIEETNAPRGLAKDDKVIYIKIEQLAAGSDDTKVTFSEKPTFENPVDVADNGTAWKQIENPQTVSITINKVDKETGENKGQGFGSLAGAKYIVYWYNAIEDKDEQVGEIITDEKGWGILEGLKPALYKVKEVAASAGYVIDKVVREVRAGIKELNAANFNYDVTSEEQPITVRVSKHSINESGDKILVPGAVLEVKQGDEVITEFTTDDKDRVLKALPVGKYTLHEKTTPEGYFTAEDVEFTVEEKEEEQLVEMFDEPIPEIKTSAVFDTGVKESVASEKVTVVDTIEYKKVIPGKEYVAKGKLVNKENPDEVIATGETKFTPEKAYGTVGVEFTFDASKLEGTTMVVFEDLYKNGKHLVTHSEITDEKQTVYVPEIKTKATDKVDDGKDMFAGEKQTIVDTVKYTNLRIGQEYTVKGKLIEKETGKAVIDNGKEVTAEKTFTAEKANGEITLEFTFNAKALAGKTIVVFEDLYNEKVKVGTHSDINDKEQSIYVPYVKTTATEKETGRKEVNPKAKVHLTDKITYENLIVGKVYAVKGELIDKQTKEVITTAEGNFKAEERNGEVELDFTFDASKLKGHDVVVFEDLYIVDENTGDEGKLVAQHRDINSEGQTVRVTNPDVKTTATIDGKKEAEIKKEILTVKDTVKYTDLVIGKEYTVKGKLMSKTTRKAFIVDGKEVTAEKTFTAEKKNGTVELEFNFPSKGLKKETLVVFENLYDGEDLIASHEDINDVDQTVKIERIGRIEMKFDGGTKTGDENSILGASLAALFGLAGIGFIRKRKSAEK